MNKKYITFFTALVVVVSTASCVNQYSKAYSLDYALNDYGFVTREQKEALKDLYAKNPLIYKSLPQIFR